MTVVWQLWKQLVYYCHRNDQIKVFLIGLPMCRIEAYVSCIHWLQIKHSMRELT